MAKQIARLLRSELTVSDELSKIAKLLQSKGRGKDTILAHITPKEAELLKQLGGSGTKNPETGLLEFYPDDSGYDVMSYNYQGGDIDAPSVAPPDSGTEEGARMTPLQAAQARPELYPDIKYAQEIGYNKPENLRYVGMPTFSPDGTSTVGVASERYRFPYTGEGLSKQLQPLEAGPVAITPQVGGPVPEAAPVPAAPPGVGKEFTDKLKDYLSDPANLAKLGLGIGGAGIGAMRARQGAKQIQKATEEQKALGTPYQTQGREFIRAAQAGELTPTSSQAYQAMQAQLAQSTATRGGVGTAQAAAQLEAFRQQLLQNQYTYGLQVANIGDQYVSGAIKTGLQLDQQLQQATSNFYTNLAAVAGGLPIYQTVRTPPVA